VKLDKDFNSETFHCTTPKRLSWDDLDPSLALGFYCRNQAEFLEFRRLVRVSVKSRPSVSPII
jgi:cysteine protease ATG4